MRGIQRGFRRGRIAVLNPALRSKIMTSSEAAALIPAGSNVGMSGFTGSGYPKAVPAALAERINALRSTGEKFKISIWTGASTAKRASSESRTFR